MSEEIEVEEPPEVSELEESDCPTCSGSGIVDAAPCDLCRGHGRVFARTRRLPYVPFEVDGHDYRVWQREETIEVWEDGAEVLAVPRDIGRLRVRTYEAHEAATSAAHLWHIHKALVATFADEDEPD